MRVIAAAFGMQKEYLESKQRKGRARVVKPQIRKKVLQLFGISSQTYGKIMRHYLVHRSIYVSGTDDNGGKGNRTAKVTRIPRSTQAQTQVRDWVRERRMQRQRTTARQVLDFLVHKGFLHIERDTTGKYVGKDLAVALRNVQRWLHVTGYKRGK